MPQPNVQQMMKQVQKMQRDMAAAQEELKSEELEVTAGGGMVTVKITGALEVRSVQIDPDAIDPEDPELLQDTEVVSALERLAGSGAAVSVVPHVPFGATVADDALAVVDLSHYGSEGAASFLVRRSPLVMALAALVAAANRLATPLPPLGRGGNRPTVPPRQPDQRILGLLATGATDQVIARHLGVSTRTVERRVRTLMDTLGAATRFQAGVLAGRRGWI